MICLSCIFSTFISFFFTFDFMSSLTFYSITFHISLYLTISNSFFSYSLSLSAPPPHPTPTCSHLISLQCV